VAGSSQEEYAGCQWYEMPHRPCSSSVHTEPSEDGNGPTGEKFRRQATNISAQRVDNSKGPPVKKPKGFWLRTMIVVDLNVRMLAARTLEGFVGGLLRLDANAPQWRSAPGAERTTIRPL
jgi:hypothetical protein